MLFNTHVPPSYWVHAFSTAIYIINRLPTSVLDNKSPFEVVFHRALTYDHFRPFGCRVFPYLRDYADHKLSSRSLPCIFLGYCLRYKGYQCLDAVSSRIYITRHAMFDERCFPFFDTTSGTPTKMLTLTSLLDDPSCSPVTPTISFVPACSSPLRACGLCDDTPCSSFEPSVVSSDFSTDSVSPLTPDQPQPTLSLELVSPIATLAPAPPSTSTSPSASTSLVVAAPTSPVVVAPASTVGHPMITRAKAGIFKPKHRVDLAHTSAHALYLALFASTDPKGFKSAAKHPHWVTAMHQEIEVLHRNNTWTLVPQPEHHNIVSCRWLFRTKYNVDGSTEGQKARLVAQVSVKFQGLIILKHSVRWLRPQLCVLFYHLLFLTIGNFTSLMSTMLSLMVSYLSLCTWNNLLDSGCYFSSSCVSSQQSSIRS